MKTSCARSKYISTCSEELERDFAAELGYVKCVDLKRNRVNCNDCVGVAARLTEKYLENR